MPSSETDFAPSPYATNFDGIGEAIYEPDAYVGTTPPEEVQVNVSGAQMFKLVVTESGIGWDQQGRAPDIK